MRYPFILFCILIVLLCSCSGLHQGNKIKDQVQRGTVSIQLNDQPSDSISLKYTGCGGFIIQKGEDIVITDPFYSNITPSFIAVPIKKVKSHEHYIDQLYQPILGGSFDHAGRVKAIMVTHAHYDHLMDAPYLYYKKLNKDSVIMVASKTAKHIMAGAGYTYNDSLAPGGFKNAYCYAQTEDACGTYIPAANGRMRITPVLGEHAPHTRHLKFYQGALNEDYGKYPHKAGKWVEGQTYTYLIDFMNADGTVNFRIFVQTSASDYTVGTPRITDGKAVDLAIICVAGNHLVEDYPNRLVKTLQPKHIILAHWENFFKPVKKLEKRPYAVPLTKVPKFIKQFNTFLDTSGLAPYGFTLPNINTEIEVAY